MTDAVNTAAQSSVDPALLDFVRDACPAGAPARRRLVLH